MIPALALVGAIILIALAAFHVYWAFATRGGLPGSGADPAGRYLGLFKRPRDGAFARMDTRLYTGAGPLCPLRGRSGPRSLTRRQDVAPRRPASGALVWHEPGGATPGGAGPRSTRRLDHPAAHQGIA